MLELEYYAAPHPACNCVFGLTGRLVVNGLIVNPNIPSGILTSVGVRASPQPTITQLLTVQSIEPGFHHLRKWIILFLPPETSGKRSDLTL